MSNVIQLKSAGGFTRMDNDLYEALIGADLSGRELRVALAIHRQTAGYNQERARIAASYIAQMSAARSFGNKPIVTQVGPLKAFYPAEKYHQDFARLNPTHPYITYWDAPKVAALKKEFPAWYRGK